jgi:hypothetical protein
MRVMRNALTPPRMRAAELGGGIRPDTVTWAVRLMFASVMTNSAGIFAMQAAEGKHLTLGQVATECVIMALWIALYSMLIRRISIGNRVARVVTWLWLGLWIVTAAPAILRVDPDLGSVAGVLFVLLRFGSAAMDTATVALLALPASNRYFKSYRRPMRLPDWP